MNSNQIIDFGEKVFELIDTIPIKESSPLKGAFEESKEQKYKEITQQPVLQDKQLDLQDVLILNFIKKNELNQLNTYPFNKLTEDLKNILILSKEHSTIIEKENPLEHLHNSCKMITDDFSLYQQPILPEKIKENVMNTFLKIFKAKHNEVLHQKNIELINKQQNIDEHKIEIEKLIINNEEINNEKKKYLRHKRYLTISTFVQAIGSCGLLFWSIYQNS
jgi:hypothetical protein